MQFSMCLFAGWAGRCEPGNARLITARGSLLAETPVWWPLGHHADSLTTKQCAQLSGDLSGELPPPARDLKRVE